MLCRPYAARLCIIGFDEDETGVKIRKFGSVSLAIIQYQIEVNKGK